MQSLPPHEAKPQVVLVSSTVVQISHRAKSCMSVLKPTSHVSCPEGEIIQPLSGSVVPVMIQHQQNMESGTTGSTFMFYMCDYNMFNMYEVISQSLLISQQPYREYNMINIDPVFQFTCE